MKSSRFIVLVVIVVLPCLSCGSREVERGPVYKTAIVNPQNLRAGEAGYIIFTPRHSILRPDLLGRLYAVRSTEPWTVKFILDGKILYEGLAENDKVLRILAPPGDRKLVYSLLWHPLENPWAKDTQAYCTPEYEDRKNPLPGIAVKIVKGGEVRLDIVNIGGKRYYYETRPYYPPIAVSKSYQLIGLVEAGGNDGKDLR